LGLLKTEGNLMKKLLLASTALVATAGMAAAEITFSGSARFGVQYTAGADAVAAGGTDAEVAAAKTAKTGADKDLKDFSKVLADALKAGTATQKMQDNVAAATTAAATEAATLDALDGTAATSSDTVIHNRFTLNIDGKTTIDSGAELFARVRIRGGSSAGEGDATSASGVSAPRVGMTTGGVTVAVGNILGALESTPGLYDGAVGLTGLGWGNLPVNGSAAGTFFWDSFSSGGGGVNGVEVIYSAGDMGIHVSHSEVSDETSAHISYAFGDWTAALAVLDAGDGDEATMVTLGGSIGGANVGLKYADTDSATASSDATTVWASFDVASGTTVTGYFTSVDNGANDDSYGLGFSHSLGGATLKGGVASINDSTRADLGVSFSF
jgi:outer membrane protein OmpU